MSHKFEDFLNPFPLCQASAPLVLCTFVTKTNVYIHLPVFHLLELAAMINLCYRYTVYFLVNSILAITLHLQMKYSFIWESSNIYV